jgi:antitoxin YefM
MPHVSLSDLVSDIAKYFDEIEADRSEMVVTRQDHEPMVILPLDELERLRETVHLLSTPANSDRLRRSIAELDAGSRSEHSLVEG